MKKNKTEKNIVSKFIVVLMLIVIIASYVVQLVYGI